MGKRRYFYIALLFLIGCLSSCASPISNGIAQQDELRVGLYKGSPTSIVLGDTEDKNRGISYELGSDLAKELNVKYNPVVFAKNDDVMRTIKEGKIDLVFTNITTSRKEFIAFSDPAIRIEKGYLVSPKSNINSLMEIDQKGVRVGISMGSSSEKELREILKNAQLVITTSTSSAIEMLKKGELDAFSTNKAILFEMSDHVLGSRVLEGVIGFESMGLGVPITRSEVVPYLNQFIQQEKRNGRFEEIVKNSGLRGVAK